MFKSGKFVSKYVTQEDGSKVPDEQIQPHGVELSIDTVFHVDGYAVIKDGDYSKGSRTEAEYVEGPDEVATGKHTDDLDKALDGISMHEYDTDEVLKFENDIYALEPRPYVIRYNETIEIPHDHVGFVFPRSRLMRANNHLSTAVWDSGYKGRGEGGLHINTPTLLEKDMRIGQILMCRADVMNQYNGSHQGENINENDS